MATSEVDFFSFSDFTMAHEHLASDWIEISRLDSPLLLDSRGIFSALITMNEQQKLRVLEDTSWDVHTDFGIPYFSGPLNGSINFHLGDESESKGVKFEPFTILRHFHTAYQDRIEIIQNFVLYHNLYFDNETKKFVDPIREEIVIDFANGLRARVRVKYLRDYLAARQMCLVRFHDYVRRLAVDFSKIFPDQTERRKTLEITEKDAHFKIDIVSDDHFQIGTTLALLNGKDIINPFEEPLHKNYKFFKENDESKFADFIVGIEEGGKEILSTCNEDKLHGKDASYLSSIFFKPEVLMKYYEKPKRYTVSPFEVTFLDQWSIDYGKNEEGLVHAFLGDLGKLTFEEQLYWKSFNVPPSGGMSKEFFRSHFNAEFVQSSDPVDRLIRVRDNLATKCQEKFGIKPFRKLSEGDSYILKLLHVPITNEQHELDQQLGFLSKYLVDSIDQKEIESRVKWRPEEGTGPAQIRFLQAFLQEIVGIPEEEARMMLDPIRLLQRLRSKSSAHSKSLGYQRLLEKENLIDPSPKLVFTKLVNDVSSLFEAIVLRIE